MTRSSLSPPSATVAGEPAPRRRRGVWIGLLLGLAIVGGAALSVDPSTRRVWALSAAEAGYRLLGADAGGDALPPIIRPLDEAALAAGLAAAWPGGAGVTVELDQPSILRPLPFFHEETDHAAFQAFVRELKAALGGGIPADPFTLCDAVRRLAPHGVPADDPGPEPAGCLVAAAGEGPLLCQHFATLAAHALLAVGYDSRVLGISADGSAFEHAVLEYYEPAARRWVLLDPDFNLAYRRAADWPSADAGAWLSARDLHRAAVDLAARGLDSRDAAVVRRETGIEAVTLGDAGAALRASHLRYDRDAAGRRSLLWLFRTVFYRARNDFLTVDHPPGHPDAVRQYVLWDGPPDALPPVCPEGDRLTPAATDRLYAPTRGVWCEGWEISPRAGSEPSPGLALTVQWTTRPRDGSRIAAQSAGEPVIGEPVVGEPVILDARGRAALRLTPGENRLTVAATPEAGGPAAVSSLRITVRPAAVVSPASAASPNAPQDAP